jgi:hypothetical protein
MKIKFSEIKGIFIALFIHFLVIATISGCAHSGESSIEVTTPATSETINKTEKYISGEDNQQDAPEPSPAIGVTLNGYPFEFNTRPIWDGKILWLPAKETFDLLSMAEINSTESFISAAYYNKNQKFLNCHFSVGERSYSTDTEGQIWLESEVAPMMQDAMIFLTDKMIEDCTGEFVDFDAEKNLIELNIPMIQIHSLQTSNTNPYSPLKLKEPDALVDTRLGSLVSGCYRNPLDGWFGWSESLKHDGFTRARFTLNASDGPVADFLFADIEREIPPEYVALYRHMKELGIDTRYSLTFWDFQNRQNGGKIDRKRLSSEEEVERYLKYVRMVVTSLKGVVGGYELWNESDANADFYQRIEPDDYLKVARRAIPLIREIDPQAKIVVGSTSSYIEKECQKYSQMILESDILPLADAISLHTVNNDASPVFHSDYYYGYDEMWRGIKKTADQNGFKGEYIADELNYRSQYSLDVLQPEIGDYHPYEPEIAAKYIGRMIAINLGLDISVGTSGTDPTGRPIEGRMIRNMAYLFEGLQARFYPVIVNSEADRVRFYTFEDQTGDRYVTIWNDGEAQVVCSDEEFSMVIENIAAEAVTAMDPFFSDKQNLNFINTSAGVEVNAILLRDYPVIYKVDVQ